MKGKIKSWIIAIGIIVILMIPIIVNFINSKRISIKSFDDFYNNITKTAFSLVYFGDTKMDDYENYKKSLLEVRKKFDIDVYTIDIKKLTSEELSKLVAINNEFKNENVYAIIRDGELIYVSSDRHDKEYLEKLINKYYNNIIPEDEVAYKTVSTYKEYMAIANSKKITMAVLGRNSCGWCNKFKPIYNEVAAEYNLDIYYFDSDAFNSTEYNKILNSGLTIPAKCSSTKTEVPLSNGFGTPLTIFTQNGKTIDCISGYTNKTGLISILKEVGLIK